MELLFSFLISPSVSNSKASNIQHSEPRIIDALDLTNHPQAGNVVGKCGTYLRMVFPLRGESERDVICRILADITIEPICAESPKRKNEILNFDYE